MHRGGERRTRNVVMAVLFASTALVGVRTPASAVARQEVGLRIVVIEGQDRVNVVGEGTSVPVVVEVRDRDDLAVSDADVIFEVEEGAAATLNVGLTRVETATNALGQASVTVNLATLGAVEVAVRATFGDEVAAAVIRQTNVLTAGETPTAPRAPEPEAPPEIEAAPEVEEMPEADATSAPQATEGDEGGGPGAGMILGLVGAAGAAALVGLAAGGDDSSGEAGASPAPPAPRPPPPPARSAPAAPPAPTLAALDRFIAVRWEGPASDGGSPITDFEVRYRPFLGSWTVVPTHSRDGSPAMSVVLGPLRNGTTYEVQVRATNAVGNGPWSPSARATPGGADSVEGDRAILNELFHATGGPSWTNSTNWNSDEPLDTWFGVSTDSNGRVTRLSLRENGLTGSLPSALGGLVNLTHFRVTRNALMGPIPSWFGDLRNLRVLALGGNEFTGSIPPSLRNLRNLEQLYIWGSDLSGSIPTWMGDLSSLSHLQLGYGLTGSIPSSLGNLRNLRQLLIHGNRLAGSIPSWLGDLTNLEQLALSENRLTGSIPSRLGNLRNLKQIYLWGNELTGPIPSTLGNLTNLELLDLGNNRLTGSIPSWLGNLRNLERLLLWRNELTGSIPSSLGNLRNLEKLGLLQNRLTGSIPAALCKFEEDINPQQGGATLPCATSTGTLEARVVPGDGQLVVHWASPPGRAAAVSGYGVRYRSEAASGTWSELPDEVDHTANSATITGLDNGTLYEVQVRAGDGAWSASVTATPGVSVKGLSFVDARIEDQRYEQHAAITPLHLPAAVGGVGVVTYVLSPALPAGLRFAAEARTIRGRPSVVSGSRTYTYTATDPGSGEQVSLDFTIEVQASAAEATLRQESLAAQGRALLSSVTGVIGERFRGGETAVPGGGEQQGVRDSLSGKVASMLGSLVQQGPVGGAGSQGLAEELHGGRGGAREAQRNNISAPGSLGLDGMLWGRSFAASLGAAEDGEDESRYTVWGAGDRQSFSGAPELGSYSGDLRSLYVGADRRVGSEWLVGAALGRSWGTADYTLSDTAGADGSLTTALTSVYPYVRGQMSERLEVWALGGYGRGEAQDAEDPGADAAGALTMRMGAAGLRQELAERDGLALSVVGGAGALSLSSSGGGPRVAGLEASVHRVRLALEASRTWGGVQPFVQVGGRYDGGDGETGAGVELMGGVRARGARLDLEARGRWLTAHSAAEYDEHGLLFRLEWKSSPDGTGLRGSLSPRWGMADEVAFGGAGLLGGPTGSGVKRSVGWTGGEALSVDGELGYGWRVQRLRGLVSPLTSYRRTGYGSDRRELGLSYESLEEWLRGHLRMEFTLGREQWIGERAGYRLALALSSRF